MNLYMAWFGQLGLDSGVVLLLALVIAIHETQDKLRIHTAVVSQRAPLNGLGVVLMHTLTVHNEHNPAAQGKIATPPQPAP